METSFDKETNGGQTKSMKSYMAKPTNDYSSLRAVVKFYCFPFDMRYEDLGKFGSPDFFKAIIRDCMAGLVVAMVAIPMAIGFAIASGLRPAQGIVGGALAGLIGALFGGSKYQVYGPTAAFIPLLNGIMALHMEGGAFHTAGLDDEQVFQRGHGMLVLISLLSAVMLLGLGLARVGNLVAKVPNCILVGFTIGIAFMIAFGLVEDALGIPKSDVHPGNPHIPGNALWPKLLHIHEHLGHVNLYALLLAIATLVCMQLLVRISVFIPAAIMAIVFSTILTQTVWKDKQLRCVFDNYGHIPQTITFTPPLFYPGDAPAYLVVGIILYYAVAIMFVGAVESLLCSRMADTMARNKGTPFHPSKELWGQGWVNAVVPLLNGFPHSGALARTALNIQLGAVTPFAGIMKCVLKLVLAFGFPRLFEMMPMAPIAGLLWYVALNMVSPAQITQVFADGGWSHISVMCVTAFLVIATDIVHGIAFGMIVYASGFFAVPYLPEAVTGCQSGADEEKMPLLKSTP